MRYKILISGLLLFCFTFSFAQDRIDQNDQTSFWKRVEWGGTGALNFSNNFTTISISPQAVYPVNAYYATGLGLQYSYLKSQNSFTSHLYGGSWINFLEVLT